MVYYHESSQSKETFRYFLVFVYFSEYKNSREQAGHKCHNSVLGTQEPRSGGY